MIDHKNEDNHRPICLLNTLSKVLELVVKSRTYQWILDNNLYSIYQSGFRHHHQTADVITRLLQQALEGQNKSHYTGNLLVDIAKAFDKVWHNGLIFTLKIPIYLGKWIKNRYKPIIKKY